ncbi:MAG: TIGR04282 family arsenosugar biosynthesis glycosyltransferase, partial [Gammaproteobacteria bacterium]|nr:TIGR04282 family arsenosugar biosynthesis glycosyltransferase [Gammaproteobacteria bacterium]
MASVLADQLPRLCIFTRAPVLGLVKTRLAATLGPEAALEAHVRLVSDTLDRLAEIPGIQCELWVAGDMDQPILEGWRTKWSLTLREQVGEDLGERMAHAIADCLDTSLKGLIVGCDCPTVTAAYVCQAVAELDSHDLILGPAEDGGYGLIGLRKLAPNIFTGMRWGTANVFAETVKQAK